MSEPHVWHLSTTTSYHNGGIGVSLPEKSQGLKVGECPWYSNLIAEGWTKPPRFWEEQMSLSFHLWLLESPCGKQVAVVCYRDGSIDRLHNFKVVAGKIVGKEDANKILGEFSPF